MPTRKHVIKEGAYYQWGNHGKKYYFKPGNKISEGIAKARADRQGRAIRASGWAG